MGASSTRAVVLVWFPFSDLSQSKLRPAVVLADAGRDDSILCQVTSNPYGDPQAVELAAESFAEGSLNRVSYARPGKLFTAHRSLTTAQAGILQADKFNQLIDTVISILHGSLTR